MLPIQKRTCKPKMRNSVDQSSIVCHWQLFRAPHIGRPKRRHFRSTVHGGSVDYVDSDRESSLENCGLQEAAPAPYHRDTLSPRARIYGRRVFQVVHREEKSFDVHEDAWIRCHFVSELNLRASRQKQN